MPNELRFNERNDKFHAHTRPPENLRCARLHIPVLDTAIFAMAWATVAWLAGPTGSVFAIAVPVMVTNATNMSYIATNHSMRPMAETNNPLENSMSVTTTQLADRLHFNFSHHVEHHMFPTDDIRADTNEIARAFA